LHLTDLHPDEFYKAHSAVAQFCHRKSPKKKKKKKNGKGKHVRDVRDGGGEEEEEEEEEEESMKEEKAGWFGVPFR
jgi:hypothetical protein